MPGEEVEEEVAVTWPQVMGGLAAPGHPMAKFMWGNKASLAPEGVTDEETHKRLHQFRLRHYSAQCMYLCVQVGHTEYLDCLDSLESIDPLVKLTLLTLLTLDPDCLEPAKPGHFATVGGRLLLCYS